jgi:hypothetical protein
MPPFPASRAHAWARRKYLHLRSPDALDHLGPLLSKCHHIRPPAVWERPAPPRKWFYLRTPITTGFRLLLASWHECATIRAGANTSNNPSRPLARGRASLPEPWRKWCHLSTSRRPWYPGGICANGGMGAMSANGGIGGVGAKGAYGTICAKGGKRGKGTICVGTQRGARGPGSPPATLVPSVAGPMSSCHKWDPSAAPYLRAVQRKVPKTCRQ